MPDFLFANNVSSRLASGISGSDTELTITAGDGEDFPSPGYEEQFALTLEDDSGTYEICYCTGRAGDVLTVERAQEGTNAIAFAADTKVLMQITAGVLEYLRDL